MNYATLGTNRNGAKVQMNGEPMNPHISYFGGSGSGKTTGATKSILDKAKSGETVIVLNWHNTFDHDMLNPRLREQYEQMAKVIPVSEQGVPIPLFDKIDEVEDTARISYRVTGILRCACRLQDAMTRCVKVAVDFVIDDHSYQSDGIAAVATKLNAMADGEDKAAVYRTLSRLGVLTEFNVFRDGDFLAAPENILELDLNGFDIAGQKTIVEFLLSYLQQRAMNKEFLDRPITIVIDECQNLDFGSSGTVSALLNEGRKLGLGLMLIAPSVALCGKGARDVLSQCACRFFFRPLDTERKMLTRYIPNSNKNATLLMLAGLKTGEFIPVITYNNASTSPQRLPVLKTYIPAEEEPLKESVEGSHEAPSDVSHS